MRAARPQHWRSLCVCIPMAHQTPDGAAQQQHPARPGRPEHEGARGTAQRARWRLCKQAIAMHHTGSSRA